MAAHELMLPRTGLTMEEGKVLRWLVDEGRAVEAGEPVVQVETDKAVVELEAPTRGYLRRIAVREDAVVPYGTVLAWFTDAADEPLSLAEGEAPPPAREPEPVAPAPGPVLESAGGSATNGVRASPAARRLARRLGVDLAGLRGSGPGGRVLRRDVEQARLPERPASAAVPLAAGRRLPLSPMRRAIAETMTRSWTTIPQFTVTRTADLSRVLELRETLRTRFLNGAVSVVDFVAQAVSRALLAHPALHAQYDPGEGGALVVPDHVGLGFAVALEDDGLVVPVLAEAETKGLLELARRRAELTRAARENRLRPDWLTGGTFTISNLGPFGVEQFQALVFPGQAAILALANVRETPAVIEGAVTVRPLLTMTLTVDHRVADGKRAAQFLDAVVRRLESHEGWVL